MTKTITLKSVHLAVTILTIILFGLIVFYLIQTEKLTRESYFFARWQKQIENLRFQTKALQEKYATTLSLNNTQALLDKENFVKVEKIKYLPITFEYLAREGK